MSKDILKKSTKFPKKKISFALKKDLEEKKILKFRQEKNQYILAKSFLFVLINVNATLR